MMGKPDPIYEKINEYARIIAQKRIENGSENGIEKSSEKIKRIFELCPRESGEIWIMLCQRYRFDRLSTGEEEAFYAAYDKSLYLYEPNKGNFMAYFSKAFENRKKSEYKKSKNKEDLNTSLNEPIGNEDSGSQGELGDTWFLSQLQADYCMIADIICMVRRKKYANSPKTYYPPLFFTDRVVYNVFKIDFFDDIVRNNFKKFDEAASIDFLKTLLTGTCCSVADISKHNRRPLSDFTKNPDDSQKPCCDKQPNYPVFNEYLKTLKGGKGITQSAFSQQYDNYKKLLSPEVL